MPAHAALAVRLEGTSFFATPRLADRAAYRQAQEANARKDQFLATLSHELRTPTESIRSTDDGPKGCRAPRVAG